MHLLQIPGEVLGWLALGLSAAGIVYNSAAALAFRRFFATAKAVPTRNDAVTLLKPLHGGEPRLYDNLATLLAQRHDGPLQLVFGVQRADDPAIAAVEALRAAYPQADIALVCDATVHGANGKLSNLINMDRASRHQS